MVAKCTRQTGVRAPSACGWMQLSLVVGWWCVLQVSGAPCQQPQLCGRCCDVTSNCSVRGGWQEKQGMVFVVWLCLQETVALPALSGYGSLCLVRCCPAHTTPVCQTSGMWHAIVQRTSRVLLISETWCFGKGVFPQSCCCCKLPVTSDKQVVAAAGLCCQGCVRGLCKLTVARFAWVDGCCCHGHQSAMFTSDILQVHALHCLPRDRPGLHCEAP